MDIVEILQIFTLVTGVIYMVMQIFQHRLMWYVDLLTLAGAVAMALLYRQDGVWAPLWAQVALNSYFIIMAVMGIFRWRTIKNVAAAHKIHVVVMDRKIKFVALGIILAATPAIWKLLSITNDPYPVLDAISFSFSIIAAWWLTRSHIEEWIAWIIADSFVVAMYALGGYWWIMALYIAYMISSVIGYIYWKKNGHVMHADEAARRENELRLKRLPAENGASES